MAEKNAETSPPLDLVTFDQGWNAAIERAAETAKIAAGLASEHAVDSSALILQLKRVDTKLFAPTAPFTHTLRASKVE